jgi:hypothetical protein
MMSTLLTCALSIATRLRAERTGVRIPARTYLFFTPQTFLNGAPSLPFNGYPSTLLVAKRSGREVNHSPPSRAEFKNKENYAATYHIRLHGADGKDLIFTFTVYCVRSKTNYTIYINVWHDLTLNCVLKCVQCCWRHVKDCDYANRYPYTWLFWW